MKALAYWHGPERVRKYAQAFEGGCPVRCRMLHVSEVGAEEADVVWLYGLGEARRVFDYHSRALRIVGDKGYFAGEVTQKYLRVSINAQQPDKHLRLVPHSTDRFDALGIKTQPVTKRGDYILLCGVGPKQCWIQGRDYGQWERETFAKLQSLTDRQIIVREKPKNAPIDGVPRSTHATTAGAIRGAWAVVCQTGNIGIDAILHGVPVIAEAGPGSVYYKATLDDIETIQPLDADARRQALADVAYWQWRRDEFTSGAFWRHLKAEGLI